VEGEDAVLFLVEIRRTKRREKEMEASDSENWEGKESLQKQSKMKIKSHMAEE